MKKPLLSVCLLTYNHAKYIRQSIDSILEQQTDFEWQLIIADDHSTDGTRDILLEYKKLYPNRIHLILQKKNVGPESNWLDLIDCPKSKYVLYAEGDDYFADPAKLQSQVDFLEGHADFALCFHPVIVRYQDKSRADTLFPTPAQRFDKTVLTMNDLVKTNFMQTNSVMYRWQFNRVSIKDVFPRGVTPGDWYLHLLHAKVGRIGLFDKPMSVYRRHPSGIWWKSSINPSAIWRKYGVAHMKLYVEMYKLAHAQPQVDEAPVIENIRKALHDMLTTDEREGESLVQSIAQQVPMAAELFMRAEYQALQQTIQDTQKLQAVLQVARQEFADLEQQLWQRERRLQEIQASRIWRMRNKMAKLRGKKQV